MEKRWRQLWDLETTRAIVPRLEIAVSLWQRSVGLLGRRRLDSDSGLWIEPCNSIHTLFMLFPIDVVFLDAEGKILRVVPNLRPWRICWPVKGARIVIELPVGVIATQDIQCGRRFMLTAIAPPEYTVGPSS